MDFSGFIDGYYGYKANRPSNTANGQVNDLYNFNDKTDQFNLAAADLTINHNPDPIGVHVDLIFGRTNDLIHSSSDKSTDNYIEQAFISAVPPKTHGTEFDFGQFVTSAGAEVIPAMSNWNYSRSLLFTWAIPYYHFGLRTSTPVTKTWTAGLQVVNGWNDVVANNGGVTIGLTSAYVKPKYTWDLAFYTGPQNADTQKGYRNLIDTAVLLTPTAKFTAYLNYDYAQNHTQPQPRQPIPIRFRRNRRIGRESPSQPMSNSPRNRLRPDALSISTTTRASPLATARQSRSSPLPMNTSGWPDFSLAPSIAATGRPMTTSTRETPRWLVRSPR
jgi:hypothetical protein